MTQRFRDFGEKYKQCRSCGELVHNTDRMDEVPEYGETPEDHECVDYDETGGVPARGF